MDGLLRHDPKVLRHEVTQREGKIKDIDPEAERPFSRFFSPNDDHWWRHGRMPQRDSYREKCYKAERRFRRKVEQRTFANITEVAKYVRTFMETPYFQRRFPRFRVCVVEYKPGSRICRGGADVVDEESGEVTTGNIEITKWGMGISGNYGGEIVILHELAHAVLPRTYRHNRKWARVFIEFVSCMMGREYKKILSEEYRRLRVPFNPVRQHEATPEEVARLAEVRRGVRSCSNT